MKIKSIVVGIALILTGLSCSGPRTFLNGNTDWTFYKQLGVLPFANLSADRFAGGKVQSAFITELFLTEKFQVVEPGDFNLKVADELKGSGTQPGQELSLAQIKTIGEKTGVQGIIEGVVREYTMIKVGQADYPVISLSIRMIDVPSGTVIWMTSIDKKGGPNLPVISLGETHTLGELTQKICHQAISDFVKRAF
jgi:polysaccharide biosynthesis protein PelC